MRNKRSVLVSLLLASAAAGTLNGCGKPPPPEPVMYKSVAECVADGNKQALCDTAFSTAQTSKEAPAYTAKAQCEAQFGTGNCETRHSSSGDSFVPMMTGFMLGNMLADQGRRDTYIYGGGAPVYHHNGGGYYSGGQLRYDPPATVTTRRSSPTYSSSYSSAGSSRAYSSPGVSSKGGFGGSAAAHGGFSGG